jgi:hypothetical protein
MKRESQHPPRPAPYVRVEFSHDEAVDALVAYAVLAGGPLPEGRRHIVVRDPGDHRLERTRRFRIDLWIYPAEEPEPQGTLPLQIGRAHV